MSGVDVLGPFTVDVIVHVGNASERAVAAVTVGLSPGNVPTLEGLHRAIGQALAALPEGWSLLDGDDFFNKVLVKKKTGRTGNFAVPRSFQFDVDALTEAARAAYVPEPEPERDDADDHDEDEWEDEE